MPMTVNEVKDLMRSSKSEQEWNDNCDLVMEMHGGGYPAFWFSEIIMSGLAAEVQASW